jgi:hypothetical protein
MSEMVRATQEAKVPDQLIHNYDFPNRPGFGSQGHPVKLYSTYFALSILGGLSLHRYIVEVEEGDHIRLFKTMRELITSLVHQHFPQYTNAIASDQNSLLISSQELPIGSGTYTVWCRQGMKLLHMGGICRVRLKAMDVIRIPETIDKYTSSPSLPIKAEVIQALNLIVGHHPKCSSSITSVGSNKHFELNSDHVLIGPVLEMVRGLIFSVGILGTPPRLLVNVHTTHSVFYRRGTLSWFILEYLKENELKWAQLEILLKSIKVIVTNDHSATGVPRLRSITGFATPEDGEDFVNRPIIAKYAALPTEVLFFSNRPEHQRYIDVYDYFRAGK